MGSQKWLRRPPSLAAGVSYPFRTSARNGALYMACAMYSCVLWSCCFGSLVCPRPWAACVALLRPRGVAPCAALRLFPRYGKVTFSPAGHAKHRATPSGVFTGRKADGPGLGETPTSVSRCPKGYPDALLAYSIISGLNLAPIYIIIHTTTSGQIYAY